MSETWRLLGTAAAGLLVVWLVLVAVLYVVARRRGEQLRAVTLLRLGPDVVRLLRRVGGDPGVPRRVRVGTWLLLAYLLLPVDLVPDFLPVVGYADDALVVLLALRWLVRHTGVATVDRHWPGEAAGLRALKRLAGLPVG